MSKSHTPKQTWLPRQHDALLNMIPAGLAAIEAAFWMVLSWLMVCVPSNPERANTPPWWPHKRRPALDEEEERAIAQFSELMRQCVREEDQFWRKFWRTPDGFPNEGGTNRCSQTPIRWVAPLTAVADFREMFLGNHRLPQGRPYRLI